VGTVRSPLLVAKNEIEVQTKTTRNLVKAGFMLPNQKLRVKDMGKTDDKMSVPSAWFWMLSKQGKMENGCSSGWLEGGRS